MKQVSAQAGFSIILDDVKIIKANHSIKFIEAGENGGYLSLEDIDASFSLSTGITDIDNDGLLGCFNLDIFTVDDPLSPVYGNTYMAIDADDWDQDLNIQIKKIDFCGAEIGALTVSNFSNPAFQMIIGAHESGADIMISGNPTIETIAFNENENNALTFTGTHLCNTFSGDPSDPSSWAKNGAFMVGDIFSGNPATIDISGDNQAFFTIERDILNGGSYARENPRYGVGYIQLNLPMTGSMRIENMNFAGTDFGPLAIDGIHVHELSIEIPGRGIGG